MLGISAFVSLLLLDCVNRQTFHPIAILFYVRQDALFSFQLFTAMVALIETFTLVTQIYYTLHILPTGLPATAGKLGCGMQCLTSPDCGGFAWDAALVSSLRTDRN